MEVRNPQFTSFFNFPVAAIQEQLVLAFNIIMILLVVLSVTQEVRDGSLRMVLLRRFKPAQVFISKFLVIIVTIFMFLGVYLILGYIIGFFMFPRLDEVSVFYFNRAFSGGELFIYTLKYYLLAFFTLVAVASIIYFIATISKSVIIALGVSVATLLGLMVYPIIIQMLFFNSIKMVKYQLLSITQIQFQGIAMMLGENNMFSYFNLLIIAMYILVFFIGSCLIYVKKDNLI